MDVGYGASDGEGAAHWRALRLLGGALGGRFRAIQVDDLPKARGDVGAVLTKEPITQTKIDQARETAVAALAAAYTPHAGPNSRRRRRCTCAGRGALRGPTIGWRRREDAKRRGDKDDATVKAIQKEHRRC